MAVEKKPETIYVTITCFNGEIRCEPDEFDVYWGDSIEWNCEGSNKDNFGVMLEQKTPFEEWKYKPCKRGHKLRGKIRDKADEGKCKYFVVVTEGEDLLIVDPTFIVRRP